MILQCTLRLQENWESICTLVLECLDSFIHWTYGSRIWKKLKKSWWFSFSLCLFFHIFIFLLSNLMNFSSFSFQIILFFLSTPFSSYKDIITVIYVMCEWVNESNAHINKDVMESWLLAFAILRCDLFNNPPRTHKSHNTIIVWKWKWMKDDGK